MTVLVRSLVNSLKRRAAALVDPRRKYNCQDQERLSWERRAEVAADLLAASVRNDVETRPLQIADFGAGNERLRVILNDKLERPFEYSGYDLHPQSERVQRLDVERALPVRNFDVVFCLGLLEYLRDPENFVRKLRDVCSMTIASYVVADAEASLSPAERRKRGWRTDYTRPELEQVFARSDFACEAFMSADSGATGIWLWAVRKTAEP